MRLVMYVWMAVSVVGTLVVSGCTPTRIASDPAAAERVRARFAAEDGYRKLRLAEAQGEPFSTLWKAKPFDDPTKQLLYYAHFIPIAGSWLRADNFAIGDVASLDVQQQDPGPLSDQHETSVFVSRFDEPTEPPKGAVLQTRFEESPSRTWFESAPMRTSFRVLPNGGVPPRGMLLFVGPLAGHQYTRPLTQEFRRRGWLVIESGTWTRKMKELADDQLRDQNASTETEAMRKKAVSGVSRALGRFMHDYASVYAAITTLIQRHRPSARGVPVVVLGASLGAISTPAIAETLPSPPSAVVMIGSGADMLSVVKEAPSDVLDLTIELGGKRSSLKKLAGPEDIERFRESTPEDPYNAAGFLASVPTLMIHARDDGVVQSEFGDLLWERAGRPERWVFPCGHLPMFLVIGNYRTQIADWVEQACGCPPTTTHP